jgi:hypothetical protein
MQTRRTHLSPSFVKYTELYRPSFSLLVSLLRFVRHLSQQPIIPSFTGKLQSWAISESGQLSKEEYQKFLVNFQSSEITPYMSAVTVRPGLELPVPSRYIRSAETSPVYTYNIRFVRNPMKKLQDEILFGKAEIYMCNDTYVLHLFSQTRVPKLCIDPK